LSPPDLIEQCVKAIAKANRTRRLRCYLHGAIGGMLDAIARMRRLSGPARQTETHNYKFDLAELRNLWRFFPRSD